MALLIAPRRRINHFLQDGTMVFAISRRCYQILNSAASAYLSGFPSVGSVSSSPQSPSSISLLPVLPSYYRYTAVRTKFVTGHKPTTRVNVKRRKAIQEKKMRGDYRSKNKAPRGAAAAAKSTKKGRRIEEMRKIQKQIDNDPDYPIPRSYYENKDKDASSDDAAAAAMAELEEEQDTTTTDETTTEQVSAPPVKQNKAPPAVITRTGSPYVYVAKVACLEDDGTPIDPLTMFQDNCVGWFDQFHQTGQFQPFPFKPGGKFPSGDEDDAKKIPVVAVLGRSNVGKSSLINAIARRRSLALTSKAPGRTQQPYFYGWVPHNKRRKNVPLPPIGFLVDLAGYGFAKKAPDSAVNAWQQETQRFLTTCTTLRRLYLLQDSRLRSPQQLDEFVMKWIDEQRPNTEIPYSVILTKADDEATSATAGVVRHANLVGMRYQLQQFEASGTAANFVNEDEDNDDSFTLMSPYIHVTSAKKLLGVPEVLASMYCEWKGPNLSLDEEYEQDDDDVMP